MKKFTNIGLSAIVAFAMMFATSMIVAQEQIVASDNVDVMETVQTNVLNGPFLKTTRASSLIQAKLENLNIWIFNGDDTNVTDHNQYSQVSHEPTNCAPGEDVPCYILTDAENESDLETLFLGLSEGDIMDLAPEKRGK